MRVRVKDVAFATADVMGVGRREIMKGRRFAHQVKARQIAMAMAKRLTGHSYPHIAYYMGGFDHTTIIHGIRHAQVDEDLAAKISARAEALAERFQQQMRGEA